MFKGFTKALITCSAAFGLLAGAANAKTYYLDAQPFTLALDATTSVDMWGYAERDSSCSGTILQPASAPGPHLTVNSNEDLEIVICNNLPSGLNANIATQTSVVIPGQPLVAPPVFWSSGTYAGRVRSFTKETANGSN